MLSVMKSNQTKKPQIKMATRHNVRNQRDQPFALRLMSFNVQGYQSAQSVQQKKQLSAILRASDADVIALQEDLRPRPMNLPREYAEVAGCKAEKFQSGNLYNTILVHDRLRRSVVALPDRNITGNCRPMLRCGTGV